MEIANTSAIAMSTQAPKRSAAKNAGMPSIIGDDPRISRSVIRPLVLWRCLCNGASDTIVSVIGWESSVK